MMGMKFIKFDFKNGFIRYENIRLHVKYITFGFGNFYFYFYFF